MIEVHEINQGNTSSANLVVTENEKYILRRLKDTSQAVAEFMISEALIQQDISPEILLNNKSEFYIQPHENVYNLQIYIENDPDKDREIDFYKLGQTISLFHSKTKDILGIPVQQDRFSLESMCKEIKDDFNKLEYKERLLSLVEQCMNFKFNSDYYIHGDLGIWNLLFHHDQIYMIDFGEVRKGNHHFDISAVISSALDWKKDDDELIASLREFRDGYITNLDAFNWTLLKENCTFWYTRGMIAVFLQQGINGQTSKYGELLMKRMDRLDRILSTI